ncbi:hypothetical protein LCGC14_2532630, partial [marine sediment metagenome]
ELSKMQKTSSNIKEANQFGPTHLRYYDEVIFFPRKDFFV